MYRHWCASQSECCVGGRLISRGLGTLAQEQPDLAAQWDPEANGDITPETVQAGSSYRATWRCGKLCAHCKKPHVWQTTVCHRACHGSACPLCCGHKVCPCQSLAMLRPDLMREWAEENPLDPRTLGCACEIKVLWKCSKVPEHGSWSARIVTRAGSKATGCPKCANIARRVPRNERGLLEFEFPEIYAQLRVVPWSLEFLEGLTSGSKRRFWWRCTADDNRPAGCTCEHIWQATVHNRCIVRGTGCPYCSGHKVCFCISLAKKAPGMLDFWHFERNLKVSPQQMGMYSHRKVWWRHICPITGEEQAWQAIICKVSITYIRGVGAGLSG